MKGRLLYAAALCTSAWLALRPEPRVEATLDALLAPSRVLSELCAPFRWFRMREVRAVERALAEREASDYAQRRRLFDAERAAALPSDESLRNGRRFVHAEVVGRRAGHFDELEVRLDADASQGLARGMPVCAGDVFVGRVLELDTPRPGRAIVELVTSRRFSVGARADDAGGGEPIRCVVGGLVDAPRASRAAVALALRSPSSRNLGERTLRVDESLSPLEPFAVETRGFLLGPSMPLGDDEWCVKPLVDYSGGLSQLAIVAPADVARTAPDEGADELFDGEWCAARAISTGEPAPGRAGFEMSAGRASGVRAGAAVAVGARFAGRVVHASWLASDVTTLADPGLSVQAVALVEGRDAPFVLGHVTSRGIRQGALELAWEATIPLEAVQGERARRATLFTGSGEPLVPRGLLLGEGELPCGPGPHVLQLDPGLEARSLSRVWARTPRAEPAP
jgi:cell shape-determining protein MreC